MSNKIKVTGLKNLAFDGQLDENKEYLISIVGALDGTFSKAKLGEETEILTFHLKADRVEQVQEIGGREIKVEEGTSWSQRQRLAIRDWAKRRNEADLEKFYEQIMKKSIDNINQKDI